MQNLLSSPYDVINIVYTIFFVGISDALAVWDYTDYLFDNVDGGYSLFYIFSFFALFTIQNIIASKVTEHITEYSETVEKVAISYMINNIVFATAAYFAYFSFPPLYRIMFDTSEEPTIFVSVLTGLVIIIIILFISPALVYFTIYALCFALTFMLTKYLYGIMSTPIFIKAIEIFIIVAVLAVVTDWLSDFVQKKYLEFLLENICYGSPFSFLSDVFDFFYKRIS